MKTREVDRLGGSAYGRSEQNRIALDSELLKRFDGSIQRRGYTIGLKRFEILIRDRR